MKQSHTVTCSNTIHVAKIKVRFSYPKSNSKHV